MYLRLWHAKERDACASNTPPSLALQLLDTPLPEAPSRANEKKSGDTKLAPVHDSRCGPPSMNLVVSHKTWHCLDSSPCHHPVSLLERKLVSAALAALTCLLSRTGTFSLGYRGGNAEDSWNASIFTLSPTSETDQRMGNASSRLTHFPTGRLAILR
ncbi:hypothetical protein G3M48_000570 [Beauveria asiatica]|uniref:Uncharacterized protein n=1 Tax=Beauveria asiatica TaxID=1069075 RepID=A0AAW0RGM5_9HYPO